MSTSLDDALGKPEAAEPVVEEPKVETPAAEPEKAAEAAKEPEQPEEPKPEKAEHMVPVSVLKGLRDEIRSLKASQSPPPPAPDVIEDPEGYAKHVQSQVDQRALSDRLNMSEQMVRMAMGDDVVDAAVAAFDKHMGTPLHNQIVSSANPYKELVNWHKQQQVAAEIGDDPAAYREKVKAEIRAELEAEMATKQVRATPAAPSLAADPNLGVRSGPAWAGPTPLGKVLGE